MKLAGWSGSIVRQKPAAAAAVETRASTPLSGATDGSVLSTCSGVGARSSLPNSPSGGPERSLVSAIGATGCFGANSALLITTRPPQRSVVASPLFVWV
jgi:hypothetical protein